MLKVKVIIIHITKNLKVYGHPSPPECYLKFCHTFVFMRVVLRLIRRYNLAVRQLHFMNQ